MLRYLLPLALLIVSVLSFMFITKPMYERIDELKIERATYEEAYDNSQALLARYRSLEEKYNSVGAEDLKLLNKLLPDNADNIKLVLEMDQLGLAHEMALTNVKFEEIERNPDQQVRSREDSDKQYSEFQIMFTTQSTYENFVAFMEELEQNLRVVDFKTISFASSDTQTKGVNRYDVSITTYYLKD